MTPIIQTSTEKKLVGKKLVMSFDNFEVRELWKSFMLLRNTITNQLNNDLISMTIYTPHHFVNFKSATKFEKWATVEVADFNIIPDDMETFVLSSGLYAIFDYKGLNTDNSIYQYIFNTWLPNSNFELDNRPHFEILGSKYKNNDPNSEEEIWIPIKSFK